MPVSAAASAVPAGDAEPSTMTIGEVLEILRTEYPDVTPSKIRFLEDKGLVEPARTPAGYRKFGYADVDRLRVVLSLQRDQYLPLKVIRECLAALDRGERPAELAGWKGPLPRVVGGTADGRGRTAPASGPRTMTLAELARAAEVEVSFVRNLVGYGLVADRDGRYGQDALTVVVTARDLAGFGIEGRHLRSFRVAADREIGLIGQVVGPLSQRRDDTAEAHAQEVARELAGLCVRLHATLVRAGLDRG